MGHGSGGRTGGHGAAGRGRELSVDAHARAPRARQRGGLARQGREPDAGSAQGGGRGRGRHPRVRHVGASPGGKGATRFADHRGPPSREPSARSCPGRGCRPTPGASACSRERVRPRRLLRGGQAEEETRGSPGPGHTLRPDGAGRGGRGGWRHPPSRTPRPAGSPGGPALPVGLAPTSKP